MTAFISTITLLADRPDLAARWAQLHWIEWGDEPGREELTWWIDAAARAMQRTTVPVAFIALGGQGEVLGGVGLNQFDVEERRDRSPWVVGTIIQADRRGEGIGQALMAHLEAWAINAGIEQVWVGTGGRAVAFYERCGYEWVEELLVQSGELCTILTRSFTAAHA